LAPNNFLLILPKGFVSFPPTSKGGWLKRARGVDPVAAAMPAAKTIRT
jgi:hypothetical protein